LPDQGSTNLTEVPPHQLPLAAVLGHRSLHTVGAPARRTEAHYTFSNRILWPLERGGNLTKKSLQNSCLQIQL